MALGDKIFVVHLSKEVSDWDSNEGAGTQRRLLMDENGHTPATKVGLDKWLSNYGLELREFSHFDEGEINEHLGRRFSYSVVEDNEGQPDDSGEYLADYDLYVRELTEVDHAPTFGLTEA